MQQKHFISHPDQTGDPQSRIVNDRKRKSSRIHVLCDVLFRLRSKNLSLVCTGTVFPFLSNATSSRKQNLKTERKKPNKKAKMTQSRFCVQWTQKLVPKPLKNLKGRPNCSATNLDFSRLQIKLGCVLSFLENAIKKKASKMQLRIKIHFKGALWLKLRKFEEILKISFE